MGRYSPLAIFEKEPVAIASAIRSVLFVLVLAGLVVMDEKLLSGVALALEVVLTLFQRGATTPTAAPVLEQGTVVEVQTPAGEPNATVTL